MEGLCHHSVGGQAFVIMYLESLHQLCLSDVAPAHQTQLLPNQQQASPGLSQILDPYRRRDVILRVGIQASDMEFLGLTALQHLPSEAVSSRQTRRYRQVKEDSMMLVSYEWMNA